MKTVYEVLDTGQDGTDTSVVGFCDDFSLAESVALGRGPMGNGNGKIREIPVWESEDDLPLDVAKRIRIEEERILNQALDAAKKKAEELRSLLAALPPKERSDILSGLSNNSDELDDDIPF